MRCPFCSNPETKVIDSRMLQEGFTIRRRRKCEICTKRFTTYESIEIDMPMVVKIDGRREVYKREKIMGGISKACQKRPISTQEIEKIVDRVEKNILEMSHKEVSTTTIGEIVMAAMRNLDPVAYIRFASVYRKFQDVNEFVHNLQNEKEQQNHIR